MDEQQLVQSSTHIGTVKENHGQIGGTHYGDIHNEHTTNNTFNGPPPVAPPLRDSLLKSVRRSWIKGVFESSLKGATFIPLSLYERSDLIEKPWEEVVQEAEQLEGPLPDGTGITQVYDESEGMLLILGLPGSGKTTLLLQLAHTLLERATQDLTKPMPAVFNLSTWALKRQPLAEWLVEELNARYEIPRGVSKECVAKDQILPLLDGLDEVAEECRDACVGAINAYRQQHGHIPLVIGSRVAEYSTLPTKLAVRRAVLVQPLTVQQIREYLQKAKGNFDDLLRLLYVDAGFREFAKNPLMLSILRQTYQGKVVQLARSDSLEEQRRQIFADYVERMLSRRAKKRHYTSGQTKYWLIWLAKQMRQRNLAVFYIEGLQIDWLENSRPTELSVSLAFALLSFPVALIVYGLEYTFNGLEFAVVNGILAGLLTALIAFCFAWLIEADFRVANLFPASKGKRPDHKVAERVKPQTKLGISLTPLFWERAGFAFLSGLLLGLLVEFLVGTLYALVNGLFLMAFLAVLGKFERTIQPAEKLVWSWKSLRENAGVSLLIGICFGVFGGLSDAYPYFQQWNVFLATMYFWLSLGVALGIIIMLMRGLSKDELDRKQQAIKPNQGIRNSLSNSLLVGLSSGTLVGLVIFFFYSYVMHNIFVVGYINEIPGDSDVIYGVGDAAAVTYLFWLINGGFATVQHLMLRVHLWQTRDAPWRYPRFLDYAYEHILLRKVGGGYIFVHKLLLEYFANLEMEKSSLRSSAESKQPEKISSISESPEDVLEKEAEELMKPMERVEQTIFVPEVSGGPLLLPCGHQEYNPYARFCSTCGRPVSGQIVDQ